MDSYRELERPSPENYIDLLFTCMFILTKLKGYINNEKRRCGLLYDMLTPKDL